MMEGAEAKPPKLIWAGRREVSRLDAKTWVGVRGLILIERSISQYSSFLFTNDVFKYRCKKSPSVPLYQRGKNTSFRGFGC